MRTFIATCIIASTVVAAQDESPCGPFLNAMETTRLPEFDDDGDPTGRVMTVSYNSSPTYEMTAVYYHDAFDGPGTITMEGDITSTNLRSVDAINRFRQSLLVPEDLVPFIAPESPVCWDEAQRRLITLYENQVPTGGEQHVFPISWTIQLRKSSQIADINADGVVNAADQGILTAAWNTDDYLCDLNKDGIVDAADLGILFSQWSESSSEE